MAASLQCPQCGADNSVPPTGLSMTCEYCGFSRPVPDAKARKKRMDQEERARRNAEQEALKRAARNKQEKQARKAASAGRIIAAFGTLLPIGIAAIVMYSNGVFDHILHRHRHGSYGGGRPGLLSGPTGERQYNRVASSLSRQSYDLVGTVEIQAAEPTARRTLNLAAGNCYALAAGSPRRIVSITLQTIPPVSTHPRHSHKDVVRVCPKSTGSYAAVVELDRPGNVAWGLFWRPADMTKPKHAAAPSGGMTTAPGTRNKRPAKNFRRGSNEPPATPAPRTRRRASTPRRRAEPPPDVAPAKHTRQPKKKKRRDGLPSEDKYKIGEF